MTDTRYLYHYTTMHALEGILNSGNGAGEMWCTNARYMNDSHEWTYAFEVAVGVAKSMADEASDVREKAFYSDFQHRCENIRTSPVEQVSTFLASFSTLRNDLSQWRGYGSTGGVAIRFDRARLEAHARGQGAFLLECVYEEDKQSEIVRQFLKGSFQMSPPAGAVPNHTGHVILLNFADVVAPRIKHPAFESEKEWRLTRRGYISGFRESRGILVPYWAFSLGIPPKDPAAAFFRSIFDECMIGPGNHKDLAVAGLKLFFRSKHIDCAVEPSNVPWRQVSR